MNLLYYIILLLRLAFINLQQAPLKLTRPQQLDKFNIIYKILLGINQRLNNLFLYFSNDLLVSLFLYLKLLLNDVTLFVFYHN